MESQARRSQVDTSPETLRVQHAIYRMMPPERKVELVFETYHAGRLLAMAGIQMRHPEAAGTDLWRLWARQHLGPELYEAAYGVPTHE